MPVERTTGGTSLIDVLDRVLDKGIVIDAWVRVSLVGIDLITVEARVVVASIDTYLKYSEAVGQVVPGVPARRRAPVSRGPAGRERRAPRPARRPGAGPGADPAPESGERGVAPNGPWVGRPWVGRPWVGVARRATTPSGGEEKAPAPRVPPRVGRRRRTAPGARRAGSAGGPAPRRALCAGLDAGGGRLVGPRRLRARWRRSRKLLARPRPARATRSSPRSTAPRRRSSRRQRRRPICRRDPTSCSPFTACSLEDDVLGGILLVSPVTPAVGRRGPLARRSPRPPAHAPALVPGAGRRAQAPGARARPAPGHHQRRPRPDPPDRHRGAHDHRQQRAPRPCSRPARTRARAAGARSRSTTCCSRRRCRGRRAPPSASRCAASCCWSTRARARTSSSS